MLRIFVFDEPTTIKLRLEGKLISQTAGSLTELWDEVRLRLGQRRGILDLGDVTGIDATGRSTLARVVESGAEVGYAHPNLQPLIEELTCDAAGLSHSMVALWKRFHLINCSARWKSPLRLCRMICAILPHGWRPCGCQ